MIQQLADIEEELKRVLAVAKREANGGDVFAVRERGFSRTNRETQILFRVVGVSDLIAFHEGILFDELAP